MTIRCSSRLDVDGFATVNRRGLLQSLGASALVTATGGLFARPVWGSPVFAAYPFSLGVASGDPAPDGFVIWTKIAPKPLERGGGMPKRPVEVEWSVATDERMRQASARAPRSRIPSSAMLCMSKSAASNRRATISTSSPSAQERSRVGRARTLPPAGAPVEQIRFAVAGCQKYEDGYFTAYRNIAAERFDFVFHYGDYIYEYRTLRPGERNLRVVRVMPDEPDESYTLDDYRHRYSIYQLDPDLQAAHASAPFVMSFDDHEVDNDWAGDTTEEHAPPELFLLRRAAAFQAWYEHLPVRKAQLPRGPDILAYRRFGIGDLLSMNVLDTRQLPFAAGLRRVPGSWPIAPRPTKPNRTMLGETQERWLYDSFKTAKARWTVLAQQIILMRNDRDPDPNVFAPSLDKWDGAVAARDRLFAAIEDAKLDNVVTLAGDIHQNWAGELKKNFAGREVGDARRRVRGDVDLIGRRWLRYQRHISGAAAAAALRQVLQQPARLRPPRRDACALAGRLPGARQGHACRDGRMSTRKSFVVENGKSALAEA